MKKCVVLSLALLLIMAFGTTVYAQDIQFKATGFIDAVSLYKRNVPDSKNSDVVYGPAAQSAYRPGGAAFDKRDSYMLSRARLKFDFIASKDLSGTLQFEMDSAKWGERGTGRNQIGQWDADAAGFEVKHAYINFNVPGMPVPVTVTAGQQSVAYGPRGMAANNDGMGITTVVKFDPATLKLGWHKVQENQVYAADDSEAYGVELSSKFQNSTVGLYAVNFNFNTYPIADDSSTVNQQANFWWVGLYADGKMGPLNYNFDLAMDKGKVEDHRDVAAASRYDDVKYSGFASRVKVDYPWDKFNFGFLGIYATGANADKTGTDGLPSSTASKVSAYVVPPSGGSSGDDLIIYNSSIFNNNHTCSSFNNGASTRVSRNAIGGTWMAKVYGKYKVNPWYSVTLEAAYFGDTTKNGNTLGNARDASGLRDDKDIGFGLVLLNDIAIYKNLALNIGLGYLFAGDALDYNVSGTTNKSPKDPYVVATQLKYSF